MNYNIIRRNEDGTIKIEYEIPLYIDWSIPKDADGNELRGNDLTQALKVFLREQIQPIIFNPDSTINEELQAYGGSTIDPYIPPNMRGLAYNLVGDFDIDRTYNTFDVVNYDGERYIAKYPSDHKSFIGIEPTITENWRDYWAKYMG